MSHLNQIKEIHANLINGNRGDAVRLIDAYGLYDFFDDYLSYLNDLYVDLKNIHKHFVDSVVSYHHIKER